MSWARRAVVATVLAAIAAVSIVKLRGAIATAPLEVLAGDGERRTGSWRFPRGGPYILGFQCDSRCELSIDGQVIARSGAADEPVTRRRVYPAGVHAVSFTGEGRLLWHPPGRRGPPEYVPASSLSAEPPETARFDHPGASINDGVLALALLAVVLGWVVALAWPALRAVEAAVWIEIAAVFALAMAIRLWGIGDAGPTWDEDVNWSAGRNYVTNILAGDFAQRSWIWNFEHPPVMKIVAGAGAQLADGYGPARVLSAIAMSLACALLVPIGRRLDLDAGHAGLWAGIAAALSPHLIGHGQIVGHESFAALWWTLAVLLAMRAAESSRPELRLVALGAVCGLAIFSRFASGLVGPLAFAVAVLWAPRGRRLEIAWKAAVILPVAALAVGFAVWPRLWSEPVAHTLEAWRVLSKPHGAEPYFGALTNQPPASYFAVYLVATAPLGLLAAAAVGIYRSIETPWRGSLVVALWLLVPLGVMLSPVRQDGVRYIIPSLLALAMLAGLGVSRVGQFLTRFVARDAATLQRPVAAVLALYLAIVCFRIRPYYIDYYGEHAGGPAGVAEARRFEMGWWGEGLDAAIAHVNEHAAPGDRVHKRCVEPSHLAWLRADLWATEARRATDADWMIVYSPAGGGGRCRVPKTMALVFEERAMGAPLVRVYRRQAAEAAE